MTTNSPVTKTLQQASHEAWKRWREHVKNGTAETAEALQAYDDSQLAAAAWLGEVSDRLAATERARAQAA